MYNKTKRQGGNIDTGLLIAGIVFIIATTIVNLVQTEQIKALQNNDKCITEYVNKIQPNPNETEERSLLLKECME
jgi:hypothetical protein